MPRLARPALRTLDPVERSWAVLAAGIGGALFAVSWVLEETVGSPPSDVEGLALVFHPDTWGAVIVGLLALLVRFVSIGWLLGVAAGVILAMQSATPTQARRLSLILAPVAGAACALMWATFTA